MKMIKSLLAAICLGGGFCVANATPVQWTLPPTQTHYSSTQAYGTFTFDADTDTYSNVALHFSSNSKTFGIDSGDADHFVFGTDNGTGLYTFTFDTPLTDAGGIVTGMESDRGDSRPFFVEAASTATVPEPAPSALLLTGSGLVWIARRRQRRRADQLGVTTSSS